MEIYSDLWSEFAVDNDANSPDGWRGGMTFPSIPPTGREIMAAVKREWNRGHPILTTGGNGDQVTLAPATPITEYKHGMVFAAKLNVSLGAAGGATRTLSVSGLTGKKIYLPLLSGGYDRTIAAGGEAKAGQAVFFYYDSTLDSNAGGFSIFSLPAVPKAMESIIIPLTGENGGLLSTSNYYAFRFRMPYAFYVTAASLSLKTAQASGTRVSVRVSAIPDVGGTSLLWNPALPIEIGDLVSTAEPAWQSRYINDNDEVACFIFNGDTTLQGLKLYLIGYQR